MRSLFQEEAVIKCSKGTGLFSHAVNMFDNNKGYRDDKEITDEIWFFFDIEEANRLQWDKLLKMIKKIRRMRNPQIRIRLLMTKACLEYWLLLHYERVAPNIATPAEKENVETKLKKHVPNYRKGDQASVDLIVEKCEAAVENGKWVLSNLINVGLPRLEDTDDRNQWLYHCTNTFTTAHEAIEFLMNLK